VARPSLRAAGSRSDKRLRHAATTGDATFHGAKAAAVESSYFVNADGATSCACGTRPVHRAPARATLGDSWPYRST